MPVTVSTVESDAGPMPKHVTVPGGTSVKPASVIKLDIKPTSLACFWNLRSSDSPDTLTTTFSDHQYTI